MTGHLEILGNEASVRADRAVADIVGAVSALRRGKRELAAQLFDSARTECRLAARSVMRRARGRR